MDISKLPLKVSKDSLNPNPARVGQAVYDILSRDQSSQTVEETVEAMTQKYYKELFETIKTAKNSLNYDNPFYVVILRKKEPWAINVLRQWYIARQTKPMARYLRETYPNHDHDVWLVDGHDIHLQWTLPTKQDSSTILKNGSLYEGPLAGWIKDFESGKLE